MSSKVPTVRQTNWISIVPHLLIMGTIIFIWHQINPEKAFLYGAITYLLLSMSLRHLIPKDHRNGIKKNNSENFEAAIIDFKKSYTYFKKHEWIDKYRFVTLLSSSQMSYREMALLNIAFCHSQIGNGEKSKDYYEKVLQEFPDSRLAKSALRMLHAMENKAE
ncbi:tetratricopeptide repeat protein [Olleya sp. HaHaR_3_96]|uniref:tetratricopeptide repeat protein n=1 Tax=Olleya sp. HaHaR_3_96 TaxID=2745560 RepID=UPI001C4F1837|nr:tetratricopeptide repeat protein [Olleya sp. HaHaR_3_96]QXP59517.1 tetratricopeptide repeat protein [Olleya sp. HaHaR_3_96]